MKVVCLALLLLVASCDRSLRGSSSPAAPRKSGYESNDKELASSLGRSLGECTCCSTCTFWGDPHVIAFDLQDQHKWWLPQDHGDFWMVRSSRISIQARYGSGSMPQFHTVILALAIGGPFLQNHTLVIETSTGGNLTWDGRPIEEAPGTFTMEGLEPGAVQVRFDDTFRTSILALQTLAVRAWTSCCRSECISQWTGTATTWTEPSRCGQSPMAKMGTAAISTETLLMIPRRTSRCA